MPQGADGWCCCRHGCRRCCQRAFRFPGGELDQAFRLCPQMKYAIGRTLAELASTAAAVDTWLGVEHINRLGRQPLLGLEDFIKVPFQEAAVRPVGRVRVAR
jgi:hypothetical protein